MMADDSVILVPLGGLGNRVRFLSSALDYYGDRPAVIVNFVTDMFPAPLDRYFVIPKNVTFQDVRFLSEKTIIVACRVFFGTLSRVRPNAIAPYGARTLLPKYRAVCSPYAIDGYKWNTLQWRGLTTEFSEPYNAIHIRRGDNVRARRLNEVEKFVTFIEDSVLPVYVASDDIELKGDFRRKFGDKVLFRDCDLARASLGGLDDAVQEVANCFHALSFMDSKGSSFSDLITAYRPGSDGHPPGRETLMDET